MKLGNGDAEYKPKLLKKIKKLEKKSPQRADSVLEKIEQILDNPSKGKPLKGNMKGLRRVHIENKTFVLIYRIDNNKITFEDLAHHDEVYT